MKKTLPLGGMKRYIPAVVAGATEAVVRAEGEEGEKEKRTYSVSASSEYEVERGFFGFRWREKLDHTPKAVQMERFKSGRAPVLVDHETTDQVGVITKAHLEDRRLQTDVRFGRSQRAKEIQQDVDDEIRGPSSIGYIPKRAKLVEEDEERGDLWLITLWEPLELSLVPVPADPTVGVGRSADMTAGFPPVEIEEEDEMKKVRDTSGHIVEVADDDPRPEVKTEEQPKRDRNAEMREIAEMCELNKTPLQREWIERNLTPDQVAREILKAKATKGESVGVAAPDPPDEIADEYLYSRAILMGAGLIKRDGPEAEWDREIERSLPPGLNRHDTGENRGSIFVPVRRKHGRWTKRAALDTKTPTGASELVFDRPGELIELYRNNAMVARAGARILTGLVGNIAFVKKTGGMTVYWVPENPGVDVTESELTTGLVIGSPKTMQGTTAYSRQFLVQAPSSGIDGENLVREDLGEGHALAFDYAALNGSGVSGQPLGLQYHPDVLETADLNGVPEWADFTGMIGQIGDANAPTDALQWMTTPLMAAKLMATLVASAAGSAMIWTGGLTAGMVAGYRAWATNQVQKNLLGGNEHGIYLGAWPQILLMTWNAMELIVDPYAQKKRGLIEVTSFQMGDVVIRQPTAFCRALGAHIS